jgi:Ca2+-binding EF-hand superfamily protein
MKRIVVCLAAAVAAAFAIQAGAQPPENQDRPREERRDGERDRGDRERGDRGRDGDRGPGRFGGGFGPGGPGGFRMPPSPIMAALDADGNGELSEQEVQNATKALMALDKNGDKKLAGDEIRPQFPGFGPGGPGGPGGRQDPAQMVSRMLENDANKDGKLSQDEMPEFMRDRFSRLDENSDGSIDKAELEAMARRFGEGRGPGGPGGPGGDRGPRERPPTRDRDRPAGEAPSRDDL